MSTLVYYAVPAFILLMLFEGMWGRSRETAGGYRRLDTAASLAMGVGSVVAGILFGFIAAWLMAVAYEHRLFDLGNGPLVWVALILAEDFCYYWFHRAHHRVRILWAAHVSHHSSTQYNLSTALRQSWTSPVTGPIFWAPLALVGFDPAMVVTAKGISLLYQFWIHTEHIDRLGPLEWIFNTPSHHRVHHGSNEPYLDKNHGGILIIWDRLFGTFAREETPVRYGLTTNIDSYNPITIAFHEWVAIARDVWATSGWRRRLALAFFPPEWAARLRSEKRTEPSLVRVGPPFSGEKSGG